MFAGRLYDLKKPGDPRLHIRQTALAFYLLMQEAIGHPCIEVINYLMRRRRPHL